MGRKGFIPQHTQDKMQKDKEERLGQTIYNTFGTLAKIVEYNGLTNIVVEFQDEYKYRITTTYSYFQKGWLPNPFDKEVCGVAYMGLGTWAKRNGEVNKIHDVWIQMIRRCYDKNTQQKSPTYKGCTVCDEWLCFANYEKWYKEHFYQIEGQRMCVDKDILFKGNKIYSPQTCCIVPNDINTLFIKSDKVRGDYPIGVRIAPNGKFQSCAGIKNLKCATFDTPEEAFYDYKKKKEQHIKEMADKYKDQIPQKVYNAMYNYQVDITD